jgi:septin 7
MAKLAASDQQKDGTTNLLGSKRPKARKTKWQSRFVKLLVIGDSGLGKTTLVRCLLAVPGENIDLHDGSSTDFKQFNKDPSVYLSTVEWDDEEDHVHWTYQARRYSTATCTCMALDSYARTLCVAR